MKNKIQDKFEKKKNYKVKTGFWVYSQMSPFKCLIRKKKL